MCKCKVCGGNYFLSLYNKVVCQNCGAIYEDMEDVVDFEKIKLCEYFNKLAKNIKDDTKREYVRGLFYGYYDTLLFSKWKKSREWSIKKIVDLLQKIKEEVGGVEKYE